MRFAGILSLVLVLGVSCVPSLPLPVEMTPLRSLPVPTERSVEPQFTPTPAFSSKPSEVDWFTQLPIDPQVLERTYAKLTTSTARIYDDLRSIQEHSDLFRLPPALPAYLAYDSEQKVDGQVYVHLTDGGWMSKDSFQDVQVTQFSGILLLRTPSHPFAWVLRDLPRFSSSSGATQPQNPYVRYQVVQIEKVEGGSALLVSGDWLPLADLAVVDPNKVQLDPPADCRWVDVDLVSQTLVVYEGCQPIFATLVSSAKAPSYTPLGKFPIFYKEERLPLFANERVAASESFYLSDVPWLMFFHDNWAIHGAYWHDHFGEPWSHGCINLSPYDARWLFQWAKLGDIIVIHE